MLNNVCRVYSENWQGLHLHYPKGKRDFYSRCLNISKGEDLLDGMWAVRSLMPDWHASFEVKAMKPTLIHPILLTYNQSRKRVEIAASYRHKYDHFVGKVVSLINGKNASELVAKRAEIEPLSTVESSYEMAARTLGFLPSWRSYPDFEEKWVLTLDDGEKVNTRAERLYGYLDKKNPYITNKSGKPSIWGYLVRQMKGPKCLSENEIARIIRFHGKRWLWWHPMSLFFDLNEVNDAFRCWENEIGRVDGVIVDLRDTSGGDFPQMLAVSHVLNAGDSVELNRIISGGEISKEAMGKREFVRLKSVRDGFEQYIIVDIPQVAQKLRQWDGPVIVITNGICASGCDFLADYLIKRPYSCSYGRPTAGGRIGTSSYGIDENLKISIPMREPVFHNGRSMEGISAIPDYYGNGGVTEAFEMCDLVGVNYFR